MLASRSDHVDCAEILLEAGALIGVPTASGRTALSMACSSGSVECAHLLLKSGARADETVASETLLHWAVVKGHQQIVSLLIAAGAEIGEEMTVAVLKSQAGCLMALLAGGGDPDYVSRFSGNPLIVEAVRGKRLSCLNALIAAGGNVELAAPSRPRGTPLAMACMVGAPRCLASLLAADVSIARRGDSPSCLHMAVRTGNMACFTRLLSVLLPCQLPYGGDLFSMCKSRGESRDAAVLRWHGFVEDAAAAKAFSPY
eukprot:PLAT3988.2.p1 GENE.PLAT3988.2~~PLAT3988.2.p1  ORF type:complete len:301 (-),score=67.86 PLAT3988.2:27-797(-)